MLQRPNPYSLRIDKILMEKFRVVAADGGRSVNKAIEVLIRDAVRDYERANGAIVLADDQPGE